MGTWRALLARFYSAGVSMALTERRSRAPASASPYSESGSSSVTMRSTRTRPALDVGQRTVKAPVLGERSFDGQLLEEDVVGALRHAGLRRIHAVDERAWSYGIAFIGLGGGGRWC